MSETTTLESLAVNAAAGDLEAGKALIESLHDHLFALLHLRGVLPPDMDDVAQVAMVQVYRRLGTFDPGQPFLPWFRGIVRNVSSNYWRKRARIRKRTEIFQELVEDNVQEEDNELVWMDERKGRLVECLQSLQDRQRSVVALRYFTNRDSEDIGRELKMRGTAVRQLLVRTRQMLRDCIETGLSRLSGQEPEVSVETH